MVRTAAADSFGRILALVEQSLDEPTLTGADLAARAFLSRFHFDRLVRASLGEPPGAFRRRLLLERAAHRLATTGDSVIAVALAAGYDAPEAFTRAFARAFGLAPSAFRVRRSVQYEIAASNDVHFHPPGGIRLPALQRSKAMDVLTRMFDHHVALSAQILERTERLSDQQLDQEVLTVGGIDAPPTVRATALRLVTQLEMWNAVLDPDGAGAASAATGSTALPDRMRAAADRFRQLVLAPIEQDRADETFIDTTCRPPQTFTYGGVLAHVLTFSAVRRTLALGALESAGIADLGAGDPMGPVGGTGADAADLTREA